MSRKSMQRDAILRVVKNTTSHPGADWVYDQVRKEIPKVSLGTVYRNLKLLARAGEIQELDIPGGLSRFDGNISNHYHFRCEKCHCIFDIHEVIDLAIERRIARKTGYKITGHHLEFIGVCPECQKQGK
jgi:Fur family peroxide stress response transcriptional regulator